MKYEKTAERLRKILVIKNMRANELAFNFNNYGLASTYGVFCTVVIILIYCLQDKILYRKEKVL